MSSVIPNAIIPSYPNMTSSHGQGQVNLNGTPCAAQIYADSTMQTSRSLSELSHQSQQAHASHSKQAATFLGLPLELRDRVYEYIYVLSSGKSMDNLSRKTPIHFAADCYPYLTCDLHLTCHSILEEILAFAHRQRKRRAKMHFMVGVSREEV